jgi:nucleotide-binding universal stress UspA family protein
MAKRILVALDRSPLAESIVPLVADLAHGSGALVRLIHVAPEPEDVEDAAGRVVAFSNQEMERLEAEGLDYLRPLATRLRPDPAESVVRFGDPVLEILREAEGFRADLIAVTSSGRSGLARALLGSVAEQVMRRAPCPVVLLCPRPPR